MKISFQPRQGLIEWAVKQTPTHFQFIGSNDEICTKDSDWSVLGEATAPQIKSFGERRQCYVGDGSAPCCKFRCLGIKVLAVLQGSEASIDNIQIWVRHHIH